MRIKALALLAASLLPLSAMAGTVTYTYTPGGDLNVSDGSALGNSFLGSSLTGSFTVAAALGDNFNSNSTPLDVLSYSFTVDGQTISSANGTEPFFEILTNASGAIDLWDVAVTSDNFSPELQFQVAAGPILNGDYVEDANGGSTLAYDTTDGSWNASNSSPAVTPEPPTLALFALGLLATAAFARRNLGLLGR